MEILLVENYEIGNGIEVAVKINDKRYRAYLQMPETGDSQHCFLDDEPENADDVLAEIVNEIEKDYTSIEFIMLTEFGHTDFKYSYFLYGNKRVYFFIDQSGDEDNQVLIESEYSDYYNKLLLKKLDISELNDDALMSEIADFKKNKIEED